MARDLAKVAVDEGIRYFLISFVDLFGVSRAKLVPAAAIGQMQRDGAAFAGFATHLDLTPADPDVFAVPDPASLIRLPWNREIGWLAADPILNGKPGRASRCAPAGTASRPRGRCRRVGRDRHRHRA